MEILTHLSIAACTQEKDPKCHKCNCIRHDRPRRYFNIVWKLTYCKTFLRSITPTTLFIENYVVVNGLFQGMHRQDPLE